MQSTINKIFSVKTLLLGLLLLTFFLPVQDSVQAAGVCVERNPSGNVVGSHPPLANGTCQAPAGNNTVTNENTGAVTTGSGNGGEAGTTLGFWVAQIVYVFTVGLGGLVAATAAYILNFAVSISLDSSAYALDFVSQGWTMLRDLANMAFIFILVYIALKVMFQAHTAGTMGMLAKVLAVALVINFSFFATRVVIDAGNLISIQFYNAVVAGNDGAVVPIFNGTGVGIPVPDLTAKIMNGIKLASAIGPESFKDANAGSWDDGFFGSFIAFSFIYIAVGAMLFMLAAAFVTAGVKFIVRIVMLWFSIITAPLALVVWSFQAGGHGGGHGTNYFTTWRKNLISHAFYPAVFLFVLLLISNFMNATESLGGVGAGFIQQGVTGATGGTPQDNQNLAALIANIGVRLSFVLVMLYFAIKASDYFEVAGASVAKTWGNNFGFNLPAWINRQTTGRAAYAISRNQGLRDAAATNVFARTLWRGANKLGNSTLDARNVKGLGKKLNLGESPKGGYKETIDKRIKVIETEAKTLKSTDFEKARKESGFEKDYYKRNGVRVAEVEAAANNEVARLTPEVEKADRALKDFKERIELMGEREREARSNEIGTQLRTLQENREGLNRQLKIQKDILETLKKQRKDAVNKADTERIKAFSKRLGERNWQNVWMPSKGSIGGAYKIIKEKSKAEKLADAAKEYEDEKHAAEHGEEHHNEPRPGGGNIGGDPHGPSTGTIGGTTHP